jgi:hypothetical protein
MHCRSLDTIYLGNNLKCLQIILPSNTQSISQFFWGGRICIWILLFQEFDFEVIFKIGKLNAGPNHMSRITNGEEHKNLEDKCPDAQSFSVQVVDEYFADIIQYFSIGTAPQEFNIVQKKNMVVSVVDYQFIAQKLYKMGTKNILRRFVLEHERLTRE